MFPNHFCHTTSFIVPVRSLLGIYKCAREKNKGKSTKSSAKLEHALQCPSGFYAALFCSCLQTFLYILTAPPSTVKQSKESGLFDHWGLDR